MKKFFKIVFLIIVATWFVKSCTVNPKDDEEVAFKQDPWFFGDTKVQEDPCTSWSIYAFTTTPVKFNMLPVRHYYKLDGMKSKDGKEMTVNTSLMLQIKKGKTPILLSNYGEEWYETAFESVFKRKVKERIAKYSSLSLEADPATMKMFDDELTIDMKEYVASQSKERELPILIIMVTTESIKHDGGLLTSIGAKIDNFNKN